jgi:hypothetical protein
MPSFLPIEVEHATTPTIPFMFVLDDLNTPRDVSLSILTFTVFAADGVTPLFPAKTGSTTPTPGLMTVLFSLTDTTRAEGGYYAEVQLVTGTETLRWHGTFRIVGV